jgi:hypothetical protein
MSNESRRLAKARPVVERLYATVKNPVISDDDPSAVLDLIEAKVAELQEILQPAQRGPKPKSVRRLRLDLHLPSNPNPKLRKIEAREWVEWRLKRLKRQARLADDPVNKRQWATQLIAEMDSIVPGHGLTVDYFMRRHQ